MQHEDHIWSALRQHLLYIIKHSVCFWCIVLTVMIIKIHLNKSEMIVQLQHEAWIHEPQRGRDSASVPFISINCSSFISRRRTELTFHQQMSHHEVYITKRFALTDYEALPQKSSGLAWGLLADGKEASELDAWTSPAGSFQCAQMAEGSEKLRVQHLQGISN